MPLKIRTSNKWREFVDVYDVPKKVIADQFDYNHGSSFFKYKGYWYNLDQFMRGGPAAWDGIHNDSAFSGVLIRLNPSDGTFQVATFTH